MTTIVHKRGIGIPSADDLSVGEIAIDTSTGTAYTKNNAGEVVPVGGEFDNSHTDDNKNVSVGVNALVSNENGYDNTAVGQWSLISNTSGADNTGIGFNAGGYNDTGSRNTSVGSKALLNPTASDNTAVGFDALGTLEDGSDGCTAVGSNAGVDANGATLQNATAIGYQAKVDADNKVQLGNSDVTLVHTHGAMQAQDYLDADGNSIIGGGGTELPEGSSDGSVLTWQTDAWKPSQKFRFQEKPTNEIVAGTSGITLAATDAETKLKLTANGFEFSHGYQPARVWIKKNPYESDPSELHVDQVFATDYLDADGNSIIGGGGGGDVDLTGYATETWVSANYQVKGNYLTSETDPVFQASVAAGITQTDIDNWNNNSGGGEFDNTHAAGDPTANIGCVGVGIDSLNSLTTAKYNTATGYESMKNVSTGGYNTATGYNALSANQTGTYNTGVGYMAASGNRGTKNTAVGALALKNAGESHFNTAVGESSLNNNTSGFHNTAIGQGSGLVSTTGSYNTVMGSNAMPVNRTGSRNTLIGYQSGFSLTGNKNTVLGSEAGPDGSTPDIENSTCIGYMARATESNTIQLGNSDITKVKTSGAVQASDFLDANGNSIIGSGGGGGNVDLTGYATETWVSANYQVKGNYLTSNSLTGYATQTWVSSNYQPKGNYLTGFTETDPVFKASPAGSITQAMINNWNAAGSGSTPSLQQVTNVGATTNQTIQAPNFICGTSTYTIGGLATSGARIVSSNGFTFYGSNSASLMSISNAGTITATADVVAYSDVRLKENIETLDGSKVYQMRGVSFTKDGREGSGVIAQELQQIAPELVNEDGEYLAVAYGNLVGYLIEAVKELKAEIEELKK